MDKKIKLIYTGLFVCIFLMIIGLLLFSNFVFAQESFNPQDNRTIGYEYLNSTTGEVVIQLEGDVVHIWNTQDDYFFDKDSGIQFTNHFQDYWTKNIFCIGYYSGEEWIKIKCADELTNFEKSIETDDETYVSVTLWKDISFTQNLKTYNMELKVNYYLGLNDENLSITISGNNTGIDIPVDLGFAWKVTDWDIPSNETDDYLEINNFGYPIKGTYDLTFKNMEESYFKGRDTTYDFGGEFLRVDWNKNLNYAVKMYGEGNQESFYVALLINAGKFNSTDEKSTTFQWIDAIVEGTNAGFVTVAPTADPAADNYPVDNQNRAQKFTSPAQGITVTEIGWYSSVTSEVADFDVAIYTHDVANNYPEDVVGSITVNTAKGTTEGWKRASGLNIPLEANTIYWIAVSLTNTATTTRIDRAASAGDRIAGRSSSPDLADPWVDSWNVANQILALYALYDLGDTTPPTYSNVNHNTTIAGASVNFSITYNDDTALHPAGQYIFSTNNSNGTWTNESAVNFTATSQSISTIKTLNTTVGETIGYRWFTTDNVGNANNTPIYTLTITAADTCTAPGSGNWAVTCSDNCSWNTNQNVPGNVTMTGTGELVLSANLTFTGSGQYIFLNSGCNFTIESGGGIK